MIGELCVCLLFFIFLHLTIYAHFDSDYKKWNCFLHNWRRWRQASGVVAATAAAMPTAAIAENHFECFKINIHWLALFRVEDSRDARARRSTLSAMCDYKFIEIVSSCGVPFWSPNIDGSVFIVTASCWTSLFHRKICRIFGTLNTNHMVVILESGIPYVGQAVNAWYGSYTRIPYAITIKLLYYDRAKGTEEKEIYANEKNNKSLLRAP